MPRIRKHLAPIVDLNEYKGRKKRQMIDAAHSPSPDYKMRDPEIFDQDAYSDGVSEDTDPTPAKGMKRPGMVKRLVNWAEGGPDLPPDEDLPFQF